MVFLADEGGYFDAPLEKVWAYLGSGRPHEEAHGHRGVSRQRHSSTSGTYRWLQDYDGKPTRFAMRWTALAPLALFYEVISGPFRGSRFGLIYRPARRRTEVRVYGVFRSPTIPKRHLESTVRRFLDTEFEQDRAALSRPGAGRRRAKAR